MTRPPSAGFEALAEIARAETARVYSGPRDRGVDEPPAERTVRQPMPAPVSVVASQRLIEVDVDTLMSVEDLIARSWSDTTIAARTGLSVLDVRRVRRQLAATRPRRRSPAIELQLDTHHHEETRHAGA